MYFAAAILASLVVSASSLVTPHVEGLNRRHHHAALAKRVPSEAIEQPLDASAAVRKRSLRKRCKPRRVSSTAAPSATESSAASSSSSAPANIVPLPISVQIPSPSSSQHSSAPSSSSKDSSSKTTKDPAPSSTPSSGDSGPHSLFTGTQTGGDGTFYGTGLGACGITNTDADFIAAVSYKLFDNFPGYNGVNPNQNPICGKKVLAKYKGKQVTVALTDRCAGCEIATSLDFSPTAFSQIADKALGRISGIEFTYLD